MSKKVIVITGPTGVGKTSISLDLAVCFNGEIINCDASQFYRHLNIGTAKIKFEDRKNIPHHLMDILNPLESYSIKEFQIQARQLINQINVPILVGGSGLYINSVVYDYMLEANPREFIDDEEKTNQELFAQLLELNQDLAAKTHPNNRRRVMRYLQLAKESIPYQTNPSLLYDVLFLCFTRNRDILYNRINERCEQMFQEGWITECIELQEMGYDLSKIKEIGYCEIGSYLKGNIPLSEAIATIQQKTRHYAKRQLTWFRNKMNCNDIDLQSTSPQVIQNLVKDFLSTN